MSEELETKIWLFIYTRTCHVIYLFGNIWLVRHPDEKPGEVPTEKH